MPRKVILDVDPGIDDALALCMALFDPRLEVVAVTAVGGNVPPQQATRNVQAIVEQLDPPRLPRLGAASPPDAGLPVDSRHLYGIDGLGDVEIQVAELRAPHPSEKIICDEVRAAPEEVTLVALGPLTNIARAFQRDPELPSLVHRIVIMGGTVSGSGNITPAAEFNIFCDPVSARAVFRSRSTKTLVPLDVTNRVILTFDFLSQLPAESTRVGKFLRRILPPAYRAYRQEWGLEGIHAHDTVSLVAVTNPELFKTQEMAGDVETRGELTKGATVFDRRRAPAWRCNMEVATDMDAEKVVAEIQRNLAHAGKCTA
ncbi:MAG: nucleoside hydrolase [Thermoguttaceae bacterium]|jgi:purine nucleosidase|nr:nucleoside hydrolase [Thermoguttaceae bacterium]